MNHTRNRRVNDPTYQEYLENIAKEEAEAKAVADAAQAAAEAAAMQTPEAQYKASINQLFTGEQNVVLHAALSDEYLSQFKQFGTIKRGTCSESEAIAARVKFRETSPTYIRNNTNGSTLVSMVKRNGLLESDPASYAVCWEICKIWGLAVDADPVEQPAVTEPEAVVEPVLTPSERAAKKYQDDRTIIVVTDPATGQQFTEHELSRLSAVEERRLRRIAEKGNSFGSAFEGYLDVKDAQHARDQEIARRAAEEEQR